MKTYDVKCPICGAMNRQLYLEETDGWMECEHCKNTVGILKFAKWRRVPQLRTTPIIKVRPIAQ